MTLSELGHVIVGYFGSTPYLFQVPPLNLQDINYENAQRELTELEKEIRSTIDFADVSLLKATAERDLNVKFMINGKLEKCSFHTKLAAIDFEQKMCRLSMVLKPTVLLDQIQVYLDVRPPFKCSSKQIYMFTDLSINAIEQIDCWIYIDQALPIHSTEIRAIITFINRQSICRVLEKSVFLPLELFFKQGVAQKEATHKITFSVTNSSVPSLTSLLSPDFSIDSGSQAVGLKSQYLDSLVTIVAAKNSNRFRYNLDSLFLRYFANYLFYFILN